MMDDRIQMLVQKKMRALMRHRERFLAAWMLRTGVTDPREAVMVTQDTVEGTTITTRMWVEHKPSLRTQVQAVVDEMHAQLRSAAHNPDDPTRQRPVSILRQALERLEAALKP